jgi:hypothetical protein
MKLVCKASLKELQDKIEYIKDENVYAFIKILEKFCLKLGSDKLQKLQTKQGKKKR